MVAVQHLKGEMIQLILSRKGGVYLVSGTPTKLLIEFYETLHNCSKQPAHIHEGILLLSKI